MSPVVSPRRPRTRSHRPLLSPLGAGHGKPPEPPTAVLDTAEPGRPALRSVAQTSRGVTPVLLAGADACRREVLRVELSATLAPRTPFSEAEAVSEVLERAPSSRMVILAGDLDDADMQATIRLLGRRHPQLPVISVDAALPAPAGGHG